MKKNLFKKVAAFVTAASMVASLGTVAFAANYDGTGIKITNVNYQKAKVAGEYDVTVSYLVDEGVTNDIGVTMLAYAGENLSVDASDYTKYNTSMQIVGIDQQEQTAQTGTFEFRVTTNGDDDAIKVAYDVPSIILVSGNKVAPAAATLLIATPREEKTATSVEYTYEGDTIQYYSYENVKDKVKAALANTSDTATLKDVAGNVIGTVPISSANIKSAVKNDNADTYTVTATIPAGTTVTSESYDVTIPEGGLDVEFDVAVSMMPWAVTSTSYGSDNKMTISSQGSLADVKSAVEAKLAEVGVEVKGSEEGMTKTIKTVTVGDFTVAGGAAYDEICAADQIVTGSVTADISGDTEVTVADSENLTFDLEVTVKSAAAAKWEIVSAEMSDSAITFNDQESTVTAESLLTAITTEVNSRTATLKGANVEETENVSLATATVAVKDANMFTYTVTIPASVGATLANIPEDGYAFEITVVVNYKKPAGVYGDVNGDGNVNMVDAGLIKQRFLKKIDKFTDKEGNVIDDVYGNVNGDVNINMVDAGLIKQRFLKKIDKFPVEK